MKQLSGYMVMEISGGVRVSYTYDVVDDNTGDMISSNNKGNFFAVDKTLLENIKGVQDYIRTHKLSD